MFGRKSSPRRIDQIHKAFALAIDDINTKEWLTDEEKDFARNGVRLDYRNALKDFYHSLF